MFKRCPNCKSSNVKRVSPRDNCYICRTCGTHFELNLEEELKNKGKIKL